MTKIQASLLRLQIAEQTHYPCMCHDWVWRGDYWELVARASR